MCGAEHGNRAAGDAGDGGAAAHGQGDLQLLPGGRVPQLHGAVV